MTDGTGFDAFEQEFADLNHRVTALRAAREDSPDVLDAVFLELELAQEELRVMCEEVTEQSQEVSRHSDAVDRDRTLLRAVFGELPVPVFVLDDGGFIRRANGAAAELLGTPTAYMAGKPFPVFVDLAARAALRSQLSAVLRGAGPTERYAADGSLYGTIRLADVLTRSLGEPAAVVVRAIEDDLNAFSQGASYRDDVAILAVRVGGVPDEGHAAG